MPSSPEAKTYNTQNQPSGITVPAHTSIVTESSSTSATDAGTYNVILKLDNTTNYKWNDNTTENKTVTWKINKYNLSNATIETVGAQEYTGSAVKPEPEVTVPIPNESTTTLVKNTHFTYGYSNNTAKGTATITVTAKDNTNYTGSKEATFEIVERSVQASGSDYSGTYNGTAKGITVTVTEPTSGTTIYYSTSKELTASNYASEGSTTNPTRKDATADLTGGKQIVYWYVHTTNTNYSDTKGSNTITIAKVKAASPTVTAYSHAYDGNTHGVTVSEVSGGTAKYSEDNSTWSETAPTYKNYTNGAKTIYVKVGLAAFTFAIVIVLLPFVSL